MAITECVEFASTDQLINVEILNRESSSTDVDAPNLISSTKVIGEYVSVKGRTHENQFQVFAPFQDISQQYEQEVSVKTALMHLIDDNVADIRQRCYNIVSRAARCL